MNKSFFGSKRAKTICSLMTVIIFTGIIGMTAKAQTERRASNIKSKGIFDYDNGTVVMDASDLIYLADEIDLLEETYKKETVKALNEMNTYFMSDEAITHDPDKNALNYNSANILPFQSIINGILASQSIPTEKTYTGTLPGKEEEITGNISAATEENLSLGTAAWVDGELIIGTGADNKNYYNLGYADGMAGNVHGEISYTTHSHTNECYASCTVTYAVSLGTSSGDGNACASCGSTNTKTHKWTLSHSACGITDDTINWIICESCGVGDHPGTGTGSVERVHNTLICGKKEGQIESALIVYP